MRLSIVQKVGLRNAGHLVCIPALQVTLLSTSQSFTAIDAKVPETTRHNRGAVAKVN